MNETEIAERRRDFIGAIAKVSIAQSFLADAKKELKVAQAHCKHELVKEPLENRNTLNRCPICDMPIHQIHPDY
jgi:Zn finger protein HypA/HybF involved in hydrogenase expression